VTEINKHDRFLSTDKVAEIFDINGRTLRVWIKEGKIKAVKINNRWKIRESEVDRLANEEFGDESA
jgi:excisionase family DNA binding protein